MTYDTLSQNIKKLIVFILNKQSKGVTYGLEMIDY